MVNDIVTPCRTSKIGTEAKRGLMIGYASGSSILAVLFDRPLTQMT